jgi:hypothetical protein
MASSQDFLQAASLHGLKPGLPSSCKSSWPQAKISSKLQLLMAASKDFLLDETIHGLKPRLPPSCKFS